ncbi:hypothetical protein Efla_007760 [Eimeria flavescens]
MAAVPVRTRKGFRKPLPLPAEMLAAVGAPGHRKHIEPVLQYDGESREWRVFWMEEPQARYKVFQSKKFGKERAQQLALEWLRRAKLGALGGSGRGPRGAPSGEPAGHRAKRGRHEGPLLLGAPAAAAAAAAAKSSSSTENMKTDKSLNLNLTFSPSGSPALTPTGHTALPAL